MKELKTPYYIVDEKLLIKNLKILKSISERTGCKILLAQKAFSMFSVYPIIADYLDGTTASGIFEARLGYEKMGKPFNKQTHIFSPAYPDDEFDEIMNMCDHVIFNSENQWEKYREKAKKYPQTECGIRINPEYSEIETDIYNPCIKGSRLGIPLSRFKKMNLDGISGLHFHTMCEQNSDTLKRTLVHVEEKFWKYLHNMKWINFGGGHHITRDDYDIETLVECINHIKTKYNVEVYLEPGEAVALNAGFLVSSVLDVIENQDAVSCAILDASAACHMPDVLEMPYRPNIVGSGIQDEKAYTYRLGGNTCLAGDIIGDYSFDKPLKAGDKLTFCDMAIYSMVKNNTFNGMPLPSIAIKDKNGEIRIVKEFNYTDFKERLS